MPTYTAVHVATNTSVQLPTTNTQVTATSNIMNFNQWVQAQRSDNVLLRNIQVDSSDSSQLYEPLNIVVKEPNGSSEIKPRVPVFDSYQNISQVVMNGDDSVIFDGINTIEYKVHAGLTVTIRFEFDTVTSLTNRLVGDMVDQMNQLSNILAKNKDMREAQEMFDTEYDVQKTAKKLKLSKQDEIQAILNKTSKRIPGGRWFGSRG